MFDELQLVSDAYLDEMGIPASIKEIVLSTPSGKINFLSEEQVRLHLFGAIPYFDEWLSSRCPALTPVELERREELLNILRRRISTQRDLSELDEIQNREKVINQCRSGQQKQARFEAHRDFFGYSPSDTLGYDFGLWTNAKSLIGESVSALGLRGFGPEIERAGLISTIERPFSLSQPRTIAYGSNHGSSTFVPKVSSVLILSHEEPSIEFTDRVRKSLIDVYGQPPLNSGEDTWVWERDSWVLTLKRVPAANGFLSLKIE